MMDTGRLGRCLLTGASGFIGRRLLYTLQMSEVEAVECVLLLRRHTTSLKAKQYLCDFGQDDIPTASFGGVETVFHLAGLAHDMRDAPKIKHLYQAVNVDATIQLAKLAAENGVKRFIYVSSIKAGGIARDGNCMTEEEQSEPEGIYGQTKRDAELGILKIGKETGMHVSVIRPALVYGPNIKGNLRRMFISIRKGWFPPLPETSNKRVMVHIDDLVRALLLAAYKKEANGEIFIVTDGRHYSTREIFNHMCLALGRKVPKWAVPKIIFYSLATLGDLLGKVISVPFNTHRYRKLLGDDCYSSAKIETVLGFHAKLTFKDALPYMVDANSK
jgi:UDP-glucose 4-epimerase